MRRGEMLALTSGDTEWIIQVIRLRGESGRTRRLPIATLQLKAVLEWLRFDDATESKRDDVAVFSNGAGEPVRHFRKAWETTVLRGNRHKPKWEKGSAKPLTQQSHAAFRGVDLHRHDLSHRIRLAARRTWSSAVAAPTCWDTRRSSRRSVTTTTRSQRYRRRLHAWNLANLSHPLHICAGPRPWKRKSGHPNRTPT